MSIFIIVVHFVTDWMLQPRTMARKKSASWEFMLKHLLVIYLGVAVITNVKGYGMPIGVWTKTLFMYALIYTTVHGVQDAVIWRVYGKLRGSTDKEFLDKNKYAEDYWWYFTIAVDQMLHLSLLVYLFC